jgi:hypothetical protein
MKLAAFLLLFAGWIISVTAVAVLPGASSRAAFLLAGIAVQAVGLVLVFRVHLVVGKEGRK